jgi:glutathione S-transferase
MLRLHGFAASNYHNVVKLALLEKRIPFEEVTAYPPADAAFLARNPTGKFPCLELPDGTFVGESKVILNYLEDAHPHPPLLPADPAARARVRELMEVIDLYLELPARRLYAQALFGGKVSDEVRESVRPELERGIAALAARARFAPFIAGSELSLADFGAAIHLPLVGFAVKNIYGEDLFARLPAVARHRALMNERESLERVKADRQVDAPRFQQHYAAAPRGAGDAGGRAHKG